MIFPTCSLSPLAKSGEQISSEMNRDTFKAWKPSLMKPPSYWVRLYGCLMSIAISAQISGHQHIGPRFFFITPVCFFNLHAEPNKTQNNSHKNVFPYRLNMSEFTVFNVKRTCLTYSYICFIPNSFHPFTISSSNQGENSACNTNRKI